MPRTPKYRLTAQGYSICLVFLKLFERIYAPLTAGLLRLYKRNADDLDKLIAQAGLKIAA